MPQLSPNAASMLHLFSQGVVNEFLARFPQLAVLDPQAPVNVLRHDSDGNVIGVQTNTWAGLIAEHTDTMKTLIDALDELSEVTDKKRRRT